MKAVCPECEREVEVDPMGRLNFHGPSKGNHITCPGSESVARVIVQGTGKEPVYYREEDIKKADV